jgi:hypothetical protein
MELLFVYVYFFDNELQGHKSYPFSLALSHPFIPLVISLFLAPGAIRRVSARLPPYALQSRVPPHQQLKQENAPIQT